MYLWRILWLSIVFWKFRTSENYFPSETSCLTSTILFFRFRHRSNCSYACSHWLQSSRTDPTCQTRKAKSEWMGERYFRNLSKSCIETELDSSNRLLSMILCWLAPTSTLARVLGQLQLDSD